MCPENLFDVKPNSFYSNLLIVILTIQSLILLSQDWFGPFFFIPKTWRKGYFNYYKSIVELKGTLLARDLESSCCSICLGDLVANKEENKADFSDVVKINRRRCFNLSLNTSKNDQLMVTPCQHIFHPQCLKSWSLHKSECPVCRANNPSID